jgi:hypothetical protein
MGVKRNGRGRRVISREAFNEDVEEKKVGFWGREEEEACVVYGFEVRELVGEFGEGGKVVVEAMENDLGVGLGDVRESGGLVQEVKEEVAASYCITSTAYVCTNHYLCCCGVCQVFDSF